MELQIYETVVSYLWALFIMYVTALDKNLEDVERHLEMGKQFLSKGQFADALTHYHAAVDLDKDNYQIYYKRATVYLAMGKSRSALPDLDKVIQLKPDFSAARLQRARVYLKQGKVESALADFEAVLKKEPSNAEASQGVNSIKPLKGKIEHANQLFARGDYASAEPLFSEVLETCSWDADLRSKRAQCYEASGDLQKAISDVRSTVKLLQDSTDGYYRLSNLLYQTGDIQQSLEQIRECLKLDPDDKECFPFYKSLKKLFKVYEQMKDHAQKQEWAECIERAKKVLDLESDIPPLTLEIKTQQCRCYSKGSMFEEALPVCSEVLEESEDPDIYCERAEAYINNDEFDEAISDFKAALNMVEDHRRAREGLQRAEKLLKQSKRKDYYKILGVRRTATKQQVMKAYRKLAQQWHPDNFQDEVEKKKAENKFIDIASAKEVLTDPEKRAKFDSGEDPLDPEQQQGSWQNPFFQGFNPFGHGGGHSFKFHFH